MTRQMPLHLFNYKWYDEIIFLLAGVLGENGNVQAGGL